MFRSIVISACRKVPIRILTVFCIILLLSCIVSLVSLQMAINRQTEACNPREWTSEAENPFLFDSKRTESQQKEVSDEKKSAVRSLVEPDREPRIFVTRLRRTQKNINQFFQSYVTNAVERWRLLPQVFGAAMDGFRYALKPFKYYAQDEYKYFLEFSDPQSSCNHFAFGVGGSWDGEKALRRKYPQCRMTGVDPVEELSRAVVESDPNSRFILAAVSDVAGEAEALIKDANFAYAQQKKVPHRALTELLMNQNQGRVIDFMTIDVEGAEFRLLKELQEKRAELPVICSFNVEIHFAPIRYNVTWDELDKVLAEMFDEAHYVVLNIDQRTFKYRRLFMFNIGDDECIQKFLC